MSDAEPRPRDYLTIFLVSCAVLLFQITLTRVLSVVMWYHFGFLAISLVMLGLGAPGVWFALADRPQRFQPACLLASGIAVPLSVVVVVQYGARLLEASMLWVVLCLLPAMLALGAVVCLQLMRARGVAVSRMYGIDLLGACLGAASAIPLMHLVPTPLLAAACGLLPLLALALLPGRWRIAALGTIALLAPALLATDALEIRRSKNYDESVMPPVYERWSPTARLTVFDERFELLSKHAAGFAWGRGRNYPAADVPRPYWLEQDGSAGTPITPFRGDLAAVDYLLFDVTSAGYQLRPARRVAVIGAGGGRDILTALRAGAESIDAVELNRHTIELVSERFGSLSGDVYHRPGVRAIASEGRSFLTHSPGRYDLIQISLIDSFAASVAGAFALAENNLYTVEAFELYLARLTATGMISTSRWMVEMPRLLLLVAAALRAEGIAAPEAHVALVAAGGVGTLLTSARPFDAGELRRLDEIARTRGFDVLYPARPGGGVYRLADDLLHGRTAALEAVGFNTSPPRDDSPYFFQAASPFRGRLEAGTLPQAMGLSINFQSIAVLRQTVLGVSLLGVLVFALPFASRALRGSRGGNLALLLRGSSYFAAIGAGFMLIENVLVQQLVLYLGHPSYALSVVVASLLLGMGVGSIHAGRLGLDTLSRLGWAVPGLLLALVWLLPPLFSSTLGAPHAARFGLAALVLLPLGALLGLFFPLGMLRFGDADKPWYWAVNGVFGVVASALSLALSMELGFRAVGVLSAAIYAAAWACLRGRPESPAA